MERLSCNISVPISLGELIDKITILQIKSQKLKNEALINVKKELKALEVVVTELELNIDPSLIQSLLSTNRKLWNIEDKIRDQEKMKDFGEVFIHLARSVYRENDKRAEIKREINVTYGSELIEEKSYQNY